MRAQGSHRQAMATQMKVSDRLRRRHACNATQATAGMASQKMTRLPVS